MKYGVLEYQNAMEELRLEIMFRMRGESLKSHLFNRVIQKKDRLAAYVQYFLEVELKTGKISGRFSDAAGKRIDEILRSKKEQDEFIDCYLGDKNEAFVRFAS